jgi:hypothetical protein
MHIVKEINFVCRCEQMETPLQRKNSIMLLLILYVRLIHTNKLFIA